MKKKTTKRKPGRPPHPKSRLRKNRLTVFGTREERRLWERYASEDGAAHPSHWLRTLAAKRIKELGG